MKYPSKYRKMHRANRKNNKPRLCRKRKLPSCTRKCKRKVTKKVMRLNNCVPFQQRCGLTKFLPIFEAFGSHRFIKFPDGSFIVTNTSSHCVMNVLIKRYKNEPEFVHVEAGSSFTTVVSGLKSIEIACIGNIEGVCTGHIQFDLIYTIK